MTIVIAGHHFRDNLEGGLEPDGLFVASDSAISIPTDTGRQLLLSQFRKVYPVPIAVFKPSFMDGYFSGYHQPFFRSRCFVAIAGGTLTAQHVLNSITDHLSQMRVVHHYDRAGNPAYEVVMHCDTNRLVEFGNATRWPDTLYLEHHLYKLVSAEVIERAIEHSIRTALQSAKKYKLDGRSFNSLRTEYAIGLHCPRCDSHKLHSFRVDFAPDRNGMIQIDLTIAAIQPGEVAVIGMGELSSRAQSGFDEALKSSREVAECIFEQLNKIIDEQIATGHSSVDYPSYLHIFKTGSLRLDRTCKGGA